MKVLLSALFFLLVATSNSFAEELRYYDVEIVVIENQSPEAKSSEHWPLEVNINKPVNTTELGMVPPTEWLPLDADYSISFKELRDEEFQLKAEVEKISNSRSQRVIFHRAWRQPGLDKKMAMPVYFKHAISDTPLDLATTEQAFAGQYNIELSEATNPALDNPGLNTEVVEQNLLNPSLTDHQQLASTPLQSDVSILEGIFNVSLSRYLHLDAELIYREKSTPIEIDENRLNIDIFNSEATEATVDADEQKQGVIYLKQSRRRMKSNELHYIDHPVLSMLVKITPYIKPEVEGILPTSAEPAISGKLN